MPDLKDGTWYLCAQCPKCLGVFAYAENPGDNADLPTGFAGRISLRCPQCGHGFSFDSANTIVRQHRAKTGGPTPH